MKNPSEISSTSLPIVSAQRLADLYTADEHALTKSLAAAIGLDVGQREKIGKCAGEWAEKVRAETHRSGVIDAFLQEYGLSTKEGIILMRLSEALIRTPDFATAQELMRDKLIAGEWVTHAGSSPASLINATTTGLRFSAAWIQATGGNGAARLAAKLGDRVLHAAVVRGMGLMAGHFVLGRSIADAVTRANSDVGKNALYSFDMLGEAAVTQADAQRYFDAYADAIRHLARAAHAGATPATSNGLSVKLSALHPRYEYAKRASCVPVLIDKVRQLAMIAKLAGVGLTLDAEEADRLELSLMIFTALLQRSVIGRLGWIGHCHSGLSTPRVCHNRHRHQRRQIRQSCDIGAVGKGRLLGHRNQTRAGNGTGELSRFYAQGTYRCQLSCLRRTAIAGGTDDLSAIRDPQRAYRCGNYRAGWGREQV